MNKHPLSERFGICQWFHFEDRSNVRRSVKALKELGVKHLRTGISWADYHRPGGKEWYEELLASFVDFEILLSIWHTPPSRSVDGRCAAPPVRLLDYADFIDEVISRHGHGFSYLELWNEPNNKYKWDFQRHDPDWAKFAEMVGAAAYWAKKRGVSTVLGGMMPVDSSWLALMQDHGVLEYIDIVGIHGFPGMWWPNEPNWDWHCQWSGWQGKVECLMPYLKGRPVWITETGLATWKLKDGCPGRYEQQRKRLIDAIGAPVPRTYWYQLYDLDPFREAIEGFHVDENEYHLGLMTHQGREKPAYHLLARVLGQGGHVEESNGLRVDAAAP
jgi:CDP-paratose 2-epimerase